MKADVSKGSLSIWLYMEWLVITTAQLHSTKLKLKIYADSNPARHVSEFSDRCRYSVGAGVSKVDRK